MRGRKSDYVVLPTSSQIGRSLFLRILLGEHGYQIFDVAKPLKRSNIDFLAVKVEGALVVPLLIRPATNNVLEMRTMVHRDNLRLQALRAKYREDLKPLRFMRSLPVRDIADWHGYIEPSQREEARILGTEEVASALM